MSRHGSARPRSSRISRAPRGPRGQRDRRGLRATLDRVPPRTRIAVGATAALVLIGVGAATLLIRTSPADPEPRARVYQDVDACLLTDSHGIADAPAGAVWQGMQEYSRQTAVRVSYLPVTGTGTAADAGQFLAGLLQRRCAVILTTGDVQNTAAVAAADGSADTEFVIVGSTRKDYANITAVAPDDPRLAGTVTETLTRLIPS